MSAREHVESRVQALLSDMSDEERMALALAAWTPELQRRTTVDGSHVLCVADHAADAGQSVSVRPR